MKTWIRCGLFSLIGLLLPAVAASAQDTWRDVLSRARGETVYFNAWGGSREINDYIAWAGNELETRYGIRLIQVKLDDTARAVQTVLAEKVAGKTTGGSVDLIWLNGENFAAMKANGLLQARPWAESLPNRRYLGPAGSLSASTDFTLATQGLESPWGAAKLVFFYDSARLAQAGLPQSVRGLLAWAQAHPGRFSYPLPPDFTGTTFLKQALSELAPDPESLRLPPTDEGFKAQTASLFAYLDALHPLLWREGRNFPKDGPDMQQKLADRELDISFAFNPAEASAAIARGDLPDTVRSFVFPEGTLGNTHFLAIPFNSAAPDAAMVTADFLLSPEAQLRKQDPKVWGDPTVLSMDMLPPEARQAFEAVDLGPATLPPASLGPVLPEPHPAWVEKLESEWKRRYGTTGTD